MIGGYKYLTLTTLLSNTQLLNILRYYSPFLNKLPESLDNTTLAFYPVPASSNTCILHQAIHHAIDHKPSWNLDKTNY